MLSANLFCTGFPDQIHSFSLCVWVFWVHACVLSDWRLPQSKPRSSPSSRRFRPSYPFLPRTPYPPSRPKSRPSRAHPPPTPSDSLLKGKALADAELLKEYSVQDGDTINVMLKPGIEWNPAKSQELSSSSSSGLLLSVTPPAETASLSLPSPPAEKKHGHSRIRSVVLSPTPSLPLEKAPGHPARRRGRVYTLRGHADRVCKSAIHVPRRRVSTEVLEKVACLPVWTDPPIPCSRSEFPNRGDASIAFEDYLAASKGVLTTGTSEMAKIRDFVGVIGMAGT